MHTKKTILLVLVVALLGFIVSRQMGGGRRVVDLRPVPVLASLDPSRVTRVRIENVGRDLHMSLERDAAGFWFITDPLAAKARDAYVNEFFSTLVQTGARPAEDISRAVAGLEPPAATLDLFEDAGQPTQKRHQIEFGSLDLDQTNIYIGVDGRVLRVARPLWDLLERSVKDYRETRILNTFDAVDVLGFERHGGIDLEEGSTFASRTSAGLYGSSADPRRIDFELMAEFVDGEWLCESPLRTRLDPAAMSFIVTGVTRLEARNFLDGREAEAARADFERPDFSYRLVRQGGNTTTLEFVANPDSNFLPVLERTWHCRVVGDDRTYYLIDENQLSALVQRFEDIVQHTVVRVLRDNLTRVSATFGSQTTAVVRDQNGWAVELDGRLESADEGLVADWLSKVDRLEYAALIDPDTARELAPLGRIELATRDGTQRTIDLGPLMTIAGVEARVVRRADEQIWGIVPFDLAELAATGAKNLLSLRLLGRNEVEIASVTASRGGVPTRTWTRESRTGRWSPLGAVDLEDREFARLVDRVLAPLGARWLVQAPDTTNAIAVEVLRVTGESDRYELVDDGAKTYAIWQGLAVELADRALFDGLAKLLVP